jgi:single-stranded-DNA-specific exonuclease
MGLIDLVALATVCDVVPLIGLNRAFVLRGLEIARQQKNRGIAALALAARVNGPLNTYHLGYLIGPRINAGGRIGDAALGTRLLSLDDEHQSRSSPLQLNELSSGRSASSGAVEGISSPRPRSATARAASTVLASAIGMPGLPDLWRPPARAVRTPPSCSAGARWDGHWFRPLHAGVDLGSAVIAAVGWHRGKGGNNAMAAGVLLRPGRLGVRPSF